MRSIRSEPRRTLLVGIAVGFCGVLFALTMVAFALGHVGTVGAAAVSVGLAAVIMVPLLVVLFRKNGPPQSR